MGEGIRVSMFTVCQGMLRNASSCLALVGHSLISTDSSLSRQLGDLVSYLPGELLNSLFLPVLLILFPHDECQLTPDMRGAY